MKTLSLSQPWATLVVLGIKRLETRSWQTSYRGPLVIHASKKLPGAAHALCRREPVLSLLRNAGIDSSLSLPLGAVVGVVELLDCVRVEEMDLDALPATELAPARLELALGDFSPGRWVWRLGESIRLGKPIPSSGQLGVFELPLDPAVFAPSRTTNP
jgi:activating signal cointegrator 1